MANLRQTFDAIDLEAIRAFVDDRTQETLHLDFKTFADSVKFKSDDKRNLAKCISGFANSDGGIIVWGVQTERDEDGVDAAARLDPIPNTRATLSRLLSFTADAAHPIVDGVLHEEIAMDGDKGFLKTLVPESDFPPHMAKLREDRYFKRSGDSFRKMEHFDIADMFGRRPKPVLSLFTKAVFSGTTLSGGTTVHDMSVILGIENVGGGIAKYPSISLELESPYQLSSFGLDGNRNVGLPLIIGSRRSGKGVSFGGGSDHVVHVESVLEVTRTDNIKIPGRGDERKIIIRRSNVAPDLTISYRITAEGVAPVSEKTTIAGIDLVSQALEGRVGMVEP